MSPGIGFVCRTRLAALPLAASAQIPVFLNINPAWSPDGRRLVFQSERHGPAELFVINADGTGERRPDLGPGGWHLPGVQVDSATATPDTIEVWGASALVWGSYFERLRFPEQPLSEQHGKFVIQWVRQTDDMWLIQRHLRVPVLRTTSVQSGR